MPDTDRFDCLRALSAMVALAVTLGIDHETIEGVVEDAIIQGEQSAEALRALYPSE